MPANVVVLGCGRSGTSIFGELFEAFGFTYRSEPYLADLHDGSDGSDVVPGRPLAVKVPRTGPADRPRPGLSVALDDLWAAVPAPRVVFWQVRHPLDAISSLRVGIDDGWGHHPCPPDWEDWAHRTLVERCAHHWAVSNGAGFDQVAGLAVVSRFEDLIADPAAAARRAADLVGADPATPEVAAWVRRVRDEDDEHFVEAVTSRRRSRPDHVRKVGRWRENLSADDVAQVAPIVAEGAARFGYALP